MGKTIMKFTEALPFQESFEAVLAGTATVSQAIEVDAVVNGVHRYMQAAGSAASQLIDARTNALASAPEGKRAAMAELFDGKNPKPPRILFDSDEQAIMTPEESAAAKAVRDAAAAAVAEAPAEPQA